MNKYIVNFLILLILSNTAIICQAKTYPFRWVYAFGHTCETEEGLANLKAIADKAYAGGLNGFVLPGREDRIDNRPVEYLKRLKELNAYLHERNLELIPCMMSFSWGDALYENDRNLTAGLPVKNALFTVKSNEAILTPEVNVNIFNAGFEDSKNIKFLNWIIQDSADHTIMLNSEDAVQGKYCLQVNIDHNFPNGNPVLGQTLEVEPHRLYKIRYKLNLKKLVNNRWGVFPIQIKGSDERQLHFQLPTVPEDGQWHEYSIAFNSLNNKKVDLIITAPASQDAEYLLDELKIETMGLINVLRRPGTPVTVIGDENSIQYEEGVDYARIIDPFRIDSTWNETIDYRFDHEVPSIKILPKSRIKTGEKLRVSWYHPLYIYGGAFPMCMSEPKVYDLFRKKVKLLHEAVAPKKYLISIEEVRGGNTCAACEARQITMAEMVGDCAHQCQSIIRENNPDAEFFMWGDLFDPNHNGGEREGKYYFHVNGNFRDSWNYIPKDIVMIPWWIPVMEKSINHFDKLGYKTIISVIFDGDDGLNNLKNMIELSKGFNSQIGFMYSTWGNKFNSLDKFGDLLNQEK